MDIDAKLTQFGQLAGWDTLTSYEKLAIKVVRLAIQDYVAGKEDEEYFNSGDFEFWCSYLQIKPSSVRERLGIKGDHDPVSATITNELNVHLRERGL